MIEDVKIVKKEESKVEQEGVVKKVNVDKIDSDPTQNKTHEEELFETNKIDFKPWRPLEVSQKSASGSREGYTSAYTSVHTSGSC